MYVCTRNRCQGSHKFERSSKEILGRISLYITLVFLYPQFDGSRSEHHVPRYSVYLFLPRDTRYFQMDVRRFDGLYDKNVSLTFFKFLVFVPVHLDSLILCLLGFPLSI